jgi:hypothetical protein
MLGKPDGWVVIFLDAGKIVSLSPVDGMHLDAEGHGILGAKVAESVRSILESRKA